MALVVQLERFEGPLGLLLHLIRKEEMDIFDINIHQITGQYLEYVKIMKQLDLEGAGDFVAMASTLIQIKSRMLLPQYNEEGEEVEGEDPRKELVQRLLEYQKFQAVAGQLDQRPLVGRDVWLRGRRAEIVDDSEEGIVTEGNALFSLIAAYREAMKKVKNSVHKVAGELQSISSRILELKERLQVGVRIALSRLLATSDEKQAHSDQKLVTFLSLLELAKMGFVKLFQSENYAEIYVEAKRPIQRDIVTRVESYDGDETHEVAEELLAESEAHSNEDIMERTDIHVENRNQEAEQVDAATDAEILAEEQRIEAEENDNSTTGDMSQ